MNKDLEAMKFILKQDFDASGKHRHDMEEHLKSLGAIVLLDNGNYHTIRKPAIETSFCFDDSYDYEGAQERALNAQNNPDYFLFENTKHLRKTIELLEAGQIGWNEKQYNSDVLEIGTEFRNSPYNRDGFREFSEREKIEMIKAYKQVLADFEKRLNTYLKRYGMSKIKSWTFWGEA